MRKDNTRLEAIKELQESVNRLRKELKNQSQILIERLNCQGCKEMRQMHGDMAMPEASISKGLNEWIDTNMPMDIVVKRGMHKGCKMIAFYVYGSTQEDILAKCNALEVLIKK